MGLYMGLYMGGAQWSRGTAADQVTR